MSLIPLLTTAALAIIPMSQASAHNVCATTEQSTNIRDYYAKSRPGVPLPVPSRFFNITEFTVASALTAENGLGVAATPEITTAVWKTIESWGAKTNVTLVVSPNSKHAFAFPSLVPMIQPDPKDGYLDVYADDGRGVHSHIQMDHVTAIYATDLPTKDPKFRTRGISFFGANGDLVLGVYASINAAPFDQKAVDGFAKSWDAIKAMPRLCN